MSFDERLRQRFMSAEQGMPHSSVDWTTTLARGKRERIYRTGLVAAAAILLVGGGALSLRSLLGSEPAPPVPAPAGTPGNEPTPQQSPVTSPEEAVDASMVRGRVLDWVKALSIGDVEGTWAMMSPTSQEYFGTLESFERDWMSAFAEGWGAWYSSDPPPETDVRVLASDGNDAVGVVTVYGQVTKEGTAEYTADSVVFRIIDAEAFVEPYSSKIEITPLEPSHNDTWQFDAPAAQFRAEVPSDVERVHFLVAGDGRGVNDAQLEEQERTDAQPPNSVATFHYTAPLDPGPQFVTIVAVDANGEIALEEVPFFVEPE